TGPYKKIASAVHSDEIALILPTGLRFPAYPSHQLCPPCPGRKCCRRRAVCAAAVRFASRQALMCSKMAAAVHTLTPEQRHGWWEFSPLNGPFHTRYVASGHL